jgi:hypothetical protein
MKWSGEEDSGGNARSELREGRREEVEWKGRNGRRAKR